MNFIALQIASFVIFCGSVTQAQGTPAKSVGEEAKKPKVYSVPVDLRPENNGVRIKSFQLRWDLSDPRDLKMGSLGIDSTSLIGAFFQARSKRHPLSAIGRSTDKDTLIVSWPKELFSFGTLELVSWKGDVLWSRTFTQKELTAWEDAVRKLDKDNPHYRLLTVANLAIDDLPEQFFEKYESEFKFCLTKTNGSEKTLLCSTPYGVRSDGKEVVIAQIKKDYLPRVLLNKSKARAAGSMAVKSGDQVIFFAETSDGVVYEFISKVPEPIIIDIAQAKDGRVLLRGIGDNPIGAKIQPHINDSESFWNKIGWQQTIGDMRSRWSLSMLEGSPLMFTDRFGGIFQVELDYQKLPKDEDRIWISEKTKLLTYKDKLPIKIYVEPPVKLTGESEAPKDTKPPDNLAIWQASSPKESVNNIANLNYSKGDSKLVGSVEIFRGFSSEISGRLTGVADGYGEATILGEVRYNKWFEKIFDVDNDQWSNLRWGLSTRYFQKLTSLGAAPGARSLNFSSLNITGKYRFEQGLWGRDETWGALVDIDNIGISGTKALLLGGGVFWARSMPRIFDEIMSMFPFMNYPKFVDMEITYFPVSLTSGVAVGSNFTTNFHGKILWTEQFFGEAGFAFKGLNIQDNNRIKYYNINLFSVTAGLGFNF